LKKPEEIQAAFADMMRRDLFGEIMEEIIPSGKLNSEQALRVYQSGYNARLTEALGETYEAVWRMLGDDEFFRVCAEYITANDSYNWNISAYGDGFPDFVGEQHGDLLMHIARFETVFRDLFHREAEIHNPDYSIISSPDIMIKFNSNMELLSFPAPVLTLWENRDNEEFTLDAVSLDNEENLILYKTADNRFFTKRLSSGAYHLMMLVDEGKPLGEAVTSAAENFGVNQEEITGLFELIRNSGFVREIA